MGTAAAVVAAVIYQFGPFGSEPAEVDGAALVANALATEPVTAGAQLQTMAVESGAEEEGRTGVRVLVRLRTADLQGTACRLIAYLSDVRGTPLEGGDARYMDAGQVATSAELTPDAVSADFEGLSLFIPYAVLPLGPGMHALHVQLVLAASGFDDPVAESAPILYEVTIPD